MLLAITAVAILTLLVLITKFKIHPFVTLLIVCFFMGLASGMPLSKIAGSIQGGFGNTLGFVAVVIALGTMMGKLLEESGGAERVARTLIRWFGEKRIHWAMMFVAFIVGFPVFFQVGFILILPIIFAIAKETGISLVKIGLPLVAGLLVVHSMIPPHPAALAAVGIFHADIGKVILYGLIVGIPAASVGGPLFANYISKKIHVPIPENMTNAMRPLRPEEELPGFGITVITILSPVFIMLLATFADVFLAKDNGLRVLLDFIGNPITALLISLLFSSYTLGFARGCTMADIYNFCEKALPPVATIILVVGGGGAFGQILVDSGVAKEVAKLAVNSNMNPIILAWLVGTMMKVSVGSGTVALLTAAGLLQPIVAAIPGTSAEVICIAAGAGALTMSHVNDAGFWTVKEFYGMSVQQTLATWTAMSVATGITALVLILLLSPLAI